MTLVKYPEKYELQVYIFLEAAPIHCSSIVFSDGQSFDWRNNWLLLDNEMNLAIQRYEYVEKEVLSDVMIYPDITSHTSISYNQESGFKQTLDDTSAQLLLDPYLVVSGHNIMKIWMFASKRLYLEQKFPKRIGNIKVSPKKDFIFVLTADDESTEIYAIHFKQRSCYKLHTSADTSFQEIDVRNDYFILYDFRASEIKRVNFRDSLGYDFYEQMRALSKNPQVVEFNTDLANTVVYPELLTIAHFYAHYNATNALKDTPKDFNGLMVESTDGNSALWI